MKKIETIVRPERAAEVLEAMYRVGHPGVTVTEVLGQGRQKGLLKRAEEGLPYSIPLVPKIRLEVVVPDKRVKKLLKAIIEAAQTGRVGDGKVFVSDVGQAVRIRTREYGEKAL